MTGTVRVGIVGCGVIGPEYAKSMRDFSHLELAGAADLDPARARALVNEHGGRAFASPDELIASEDVDVVVNLTIHHAHKDVTTRALEGGKHVFSEKPLAMTAAEARELVDLAHERGLRLGCAPVTFLNEAQQTAARVLRSGALGPVRLAYAEVNHGRIETWHPAPQPFYEVGPLMDVGVYPLTLLTAFLGPARRVTAFQTVLMPDRTTKRDLPFTVSTPDLTVAMVELASGTLVRLTTNFYVGSQTHQGSGIEFHGDRASLHLSSWFDARASVSVAGFNKTYEPVEPARVPASGTRWAGGLAEMGSAMLEDRPHRATGEQAAHVVEIMEAAAESGRTGGPVELKTSFTPPAPMEWAADEAGAG